MSNLNDLFGPASGLPTGEPRRLSELTDSIASHPEGERVPHLRMWCDPAMTSLYLDGTKVYELHFENLVHLRSITLYGCPLERFPTITHMVELVTLEFSYGSLFRVIPDLSPLVNLKTFYMDSSELEDASGIVSVPSLENLAISKNALTQLPRLDNLTGLKTFSVDGNQLTELPPLSHMTTLDSLHCQKNQLTELPELTGLTSLRYLYCNENSLAQLPALAGMTELFYFVCNDNQLTGLPDLADLEKIRYVRAHNNQLTAEAIDNALIQLAATTTTNNGQFNYSGNPGSANNLRSTEAAAAKTTLTGRGWSITV